MATAKRHTITARQAGACIKQLYLMLQGVEPSEPMDEAAENRMEAGRVMKDVVSRALRREGWELRQTRQVVEIAVGDHVKVTALPDELARHESITAGEWVIVQTGSAKESSFRQWTKQSSFKSYPHRIHQLAVLIEGYRHGNSAPVALNLDEPQMIAMLNRDTGALDYEPIERDELDGITAELMQNTRDLSDAIENEETPNAPYRRTSRQCRQCPYLTLCHGREEKRKGESIGKEQIHAALAVMDDLYDDVEEAKPKTRQYEKAKNVVREYMIANDLTEIEIKTDSRIWKGSLKKDARTNISADKARARVSAAVMAEISTTSHVLTLGPG